MRIMFKTAGLGLLALFLTTGNIFAQESSAIPGQGDRKGLLNLSDQQKEMLKQRAEKIKALKEEFKSSVSQKQKDILEDPRVMPAERQKEFRASLTDSQVSMIKSHREEIKKMREQFRATLTPEQKAAIARIRMGRNLMKKKTGAGRFSFMPVPD
jgi:hypothetical protein